MKATATLTSKGQITIPKVVRGLLGLHAGDALEFDVRRGKVQLRPAKPRRLSSGILKAHLPKGWNAPAVEDFDAGISRHLAAKNRAS